MLGLSVYSSVPKLKYAEKYGLEEYDIERTDPVLIKVIETIGTSVASGIYAELKIIEIPDDVKYYIAEYNGVETINEEHRSWS